MGVADEGIPVYTTLSDLYGSLGTSLNHAENWNLLAEEFRKRFGRTPAYIARAPGRVNLIGEHIDYALFGVLPAAIERDILIACAPRDPSTSDSNSDLHGPGSVVAENLDGKYTKRVFAPRPSIEAVPESIRAGDWYLDINTKELHWDSYVKAGYCGVLSHYFTSTESASTDELAHQPIPVNLLVTGSVPSGSGLSSSAAMVVASTLAFLAVNGKLDHDQKHKPLSKGSLVKLAMENEKRVGVNSGGMDQAASVMSNPSSALYIAFYPSLTATPVSLPKRAVFICANSLVVSDKAVTAKHRYNLRVVETLVGARVLARELGIRVGDKEKITYREVLGRFADEKDGEDMGIDALTAALEKITNRLDVLKPVDAEKNGEYGVTMEDMVRLSGLSPETFQEVYLSWVDIEATHFQLYKRAKHVFSEALRVLQFRRVCLTTSDYDKQSGNLVQLEDLGRLMNESQTSCAELFECSCPELDMLTRLAREAGAFGSRLTGAGWGGCTVSLVSEDKVDAFIQRIRTSYPPYQTLDSKVLDEVIFATKPSSGACGKWSINKLLVCS